MITGSEEFVNPFFEKNAEMPSLTPERRLWYP
jgi:hypothetical protein